MTDGEFCSDNHEGQSRLSYRIEVSRCRFFKAVSVFVFFLKSVRFSVSVLLKTVVSAFLNANLLVFSKVYFSA